VRSAVFDENALVCHDCGALTEAEAPLEITACVMKCPHCASIDAIMLYGNEEICQICGLDPNEVDPPIEKLAHLWKRRTDKTPEDEKPLIRELMLMKNASGEERFRPTSRIGNFLRTICGPHCALASECPQTTANLGRCFREERETPGEDMPKRRKKNKAEKARRKEEKKAWNRLHSRAWLFASPTGWYVSELNYEPETVYQEQSGTSGDRSGT
jgi:hypothetical protein